MHNLSKRHSFMHSSLRVPPQRFNQVEVWTSTGPLQHLDSFLFQAFCCRLAAVFGFFLSCWWPSFSQLLSNRWRHIWLLNTFIYRGVQSWLNDCNVSRSCGCKTSPNHHPSTTVLDSWYGVFVLIFCDINLMLCPVTWKLENERVYFLLRVIVNRK